MGISSAYLGRVETARLLSVVPVPGQEAVGVNWGTGAPSEAVDIFLGDVQKPPGHGPGSPAQGVPAGAGVGQRRTGSPANLNCSGILGKAIW